MKKVFLCVIMLIFSLSVVSCGPKSSTASNAETAKEEKKAEATKKTETPEEAAESLMEAIKTADSEKTASYVEGGIFKEITWNAEVSDKIKAKQLEAANSIAKNLEYNIIEVTEENGIVTVKTEVSNLSAEQILKNAFGKALAFAFSEADFAEMPDEEIDIMTYDFIIESVEDSEIERVTNEIGIVLEMNDGGWRVKNPAEVADAVFGGINSSMEDMAQNLGGTIE